MIVERASVDAFVNQVSDAWNSNDGGAFADLFTSAGSQINPSDGRADARTAIATMYSQYVRECCPALRQT